MRCYIMGQWFWDFLEHFLSCASDIFGTPLSQRVILGYMNEDIISSYRKITFNSAAEICVDF